MKEFGIFTSPNENSFKSHDQIKREMALNGELPPVYTTPLISPPDLNKLLQQAQKRAEMMKEISPIKEGKLGIRLFNTSVIHFMGDLHYGHPDTDYKRINQELTAIKNSPNHYVVFMGDLLDGIYWGGTSQAEQSANLNEQHQFLRALFREMRGKILFGVSGEHCSKWASKTGQDPYSILYEVSGAPYIRGTGEVEIEVGDQIYKLVVAHKMRGHSMYNKNHPTFREARFNLQGADIYVSAHTHQKQIAQEAIRTFGGSRMITHISIGPYKTGDEYGDRQGFVRQTPNEMYGASVLIYKDEKSVEVLSDILKAVKNWNNLS